MRQGRHEAVARQQLRSPYLFWAGAALVLGVGAGLVLARAAPRRPRRSPTRAQVDYSSRSGFPRPASEMRGRARGARKPSAVPA